MSTRDDDGRRQNISRENNMTENIYVENLYMEHMHGQISIRYTDSFGKEWIQEGLGVCISGDRNISKQGEYFTLTFECVSFVHPRKEVVKVKT